MQEYQQFQDDYKDKVKFSLEDLSLFTAFNNMGFNAIDPNNGKLMLKYLWQNNIRDIFVELGIKLGLDLDLGIIDLTSIGLNTEILSSKIINL